MTVTKESQTKRAVLRCPRCKKRLGAGAPACPNCRNVVTLLQKGERS